MAVTDKLLSGYDDIRPILGTLGPAWLSSLREAGFRAYAEAGTPTVRDEEFKYLPLPELVTGVWKPAYGAILERADLDGTTLGAVDGAAVVFVNGQAAPDLMGAAELPEGVYVGTLEDLPEAISVEGVLGSVATLRGKLGSTNDERFASLNSAHLGEVAVVWVPKGVTVEAPIHVRYVAQAGEGDMAVYPRTLVVLGENAEATVVESYEGLVGRILDVPVTEVVLEASARLGHVRLVEEGAESLHIATVAVRQGMSSAYDLASINLGGAKIRNDVNVDVRGERTHTRLDGVNVGDGDQILDNHTRLDHAVPNCESFEAYKTILKGRATGVFNGKIFVYEDAQKTDAKQTNAALLLSPQATMNSKPQLEIFADDVKCTHGATIGQLREDALFYLRARGIPKAQAEALLVYAFAAEVLERIKGEDLRERLERALFRKLGA